MRLEGPRRQPARLASRCWCGSATCAPATSSSTLGPNAGTYTVLAADLGASVVAVEAAADVATLLRENVALNGFEEVSVVEAAAGASVGRIGFTEGLDSLNRIDPTGAIEVDEVTLDSLIGDRWVAGVKVDVEGFELDVMKGGARRALCGAPD